MVQVISSQFNIDGRNQWHVDRIEKLRRLFDKREHELGDKFTMLHRAHLVARYLHRGERRNDGKSFYSHLKWVSEYPYFTDTQKIIALLHDVIERGNTNAEDLMYLGFPSHIAHMTAILSSKGMLYFNSTEEVNKYEDARLVKFRDNLHNKLDRTIRKNKLEFAIGQLGENDEAERQNLERRLEYHIDRYWYVVPLNMAFMDACEDYEEVVDWKITQFVESDYCPLSLSGLEKLNKSHSRYPQGLTSHLPHSSLK